MFVRVGPLVRATSTTSVVIWAECAQAETVALYAQPLHEQGDVVTTTVSTVMVGGRHYVAPQLQGLQPGTWYRYQLISANSKEPLWGQTTPPVQYFRTFDQSAGQTLRIAYGSCRKTTDQATDVLNSFGNWLTAHQEEREQVWPHTLLLIGDQIYADDPPPALIRQYAHLQQGARIFEDFALIYEHAWTYADGIRQVLAVLPTFMIFDDHEITNNWNGTPTWQAQMLQTGKEQLLIDGLVAYWVYQGWGNITTRDETRHPLLQIMRKAAKSGKDALDALRTHIKAEIRGSTKLSWHYEISTTPAIFVTNTRTERPAIVGKQPGDRYAPARIVGQEQIAEFRKWAATRQEGLLFVTSSVPILLPPVIGLAEYWAGKRLWYRSNGPLCWLGCQLARVQQWFAEKARFDHWPLYEQSWHELLQIWREQQKDLFVLSGDVHFSYSVEATSPRADTSEPCIYQLVSTPLQNELSRSDRRKIEIQSAIKQSTYGRLHTEIVPLEPLRQGVSLSHNLLFENVLAMVTLRFQADGTYHVQQEYLGLVDGQLEEIARTLFPQRVMEQTL